MSWNWALIAIGIVLLVFIVGIIAARRSVQDMKETVVLFVADDEVAATLESWNESTTEEQRAATEVEGPTYVREYDVGDGSLQDGWLIQVVGHEDRLLAERLATDILARFIQTQET